jgi:hypothetical protein
MSLTKLILSKVDPNLYGKLTGVPYEQARLAAPQYIQHLNKRHSTSNPGGL